MRAIWHDLWGSGRGPARRLAPGSRLAAGAILFVASLAAPAERIPGMAVIALVTAGWAAACGLRPRAVRSFALLGLAMFLPYFLLTPLLLKGPAQSGIPGPDRLMGALSAPWDVFLHGFAGLFLTASTVTSISVSDFRRGLLELRLPSLFSGIVIQIVHQSGALLGETKRVAEAIAVRSGSCGAATVLHVLSSVPRVWLPRVIDRADRVTAAMELRGYAETDLRIMGRTDLRAIDAAAIAGALAVLALAIGIRGGWVG